MINGGYEFLTNEFLEDGAIYSGEVSSERHTVLPEKTILKQWEQNYNSKEIHHMCLKSKGQLMYF